MDKKIILLGSGGHAAVLMAVMQRLDMKVSGVITPELKVGQMWQGVPVLGDDDFLTASLVHGYVLVNGVGSLPNDAGVRLQLFERFSSLGFHFQTLVDLAAERIGSVGLEAGAQLLPGCIVQTGTKIARNTIVNTGAIIP